MSPRYWTCHWQFRLWTPSVNREHIPIDHTAGNQFTARGIRPGDTVYIISLSGGQLFLGGRMTVGRIADQKAAMLALGNDDLYIAKEHLLAASGSGTTLSLRRRLSPSLTRKLRFITKKGEKGPFFTSNTELDNQATRGIRELTESSALLLEEIIRVTDSMPEGQELLTVTEDHLGKRSGDAAGDVCLPEEFPGDLGYIEGHVRRVTVNRYERDRRARARCIEHYSPRCAACDLLFLEVYGASAADFIHVHHRRPLSECNDSYEVDPVADLIPVCPNCHAFIHLGASVKTVEEVRSIVLERRKANGDTPHRRPREAGR